MPVFKVMQEKLKKTWRTVDAQSNQSEDVKRETVYCLDDDNETEVQVNETIQGERVITLMILVLILNVFFFNKNINVLSGFRYGSDIVPFSKVDQEQMKYKHDGKCFAVLGFTKSSLVLYLCVINELQVKPISVCANLNHLLQGAAPPLHRKSGH